MKLFWGCTAHLQVASPLVWVMANVCVVGSEDATNDVGLTVNAQGPGGGGVGSGGAAS
jgi:hypothetical protein